MTQRLPSYRPTTLKMADRHCPRALDFYEEDRATFRDHYGVGIAAHAILETLGMLTVEKGEQLSMEEKRTAAVRMSERLVAVGRKFEDTQEPPLSPMQAAEGMRLALAYAEENPLATDVCYETGYETGYEIGVAFDENWSRVAYSPEARFRLIFDQISIIKDEDEEREAWGILVRDYKSSWATDGEELWTWQMKAQAVAAALMVQNGHWRPELPACSFIRRQAVNLRTRETFSEDIWLDDAGLAQLRTWRDQITVLMRALDTRTEGRRAARPGHGCMGCAYVMSCADAKDFLGAAMESVDRPMDPERLARAFCIADAQRQRLFDLCKLATEEGAIQLDKTVFVGSLPKAGQAPKKDAGTRALSTWTAEGGDAEGFLTAAQPGITSLKAVAKALRKGKPQEQEELVKQWTEPKLSRSFGLHHIDEPTEA